MVISIKILFIGASVAVTATSVGLFGVIFSKLLGTTVNSYSAYTCGAFNSLSLNEFTKHCTMLLCTAGIASFINGLLRRNFVKVC